MFIIREFGGKDIWMFIVLFLEYFVGLKLKNNNNFEWKIIFLSFDNRIIYKRQKKKIDVFLCKFEMFKYKNKK